MEYNKLKIFSLPESVIIQITDIEFPYVEYFYTDRCIKYDEINKISNEKTKLRALVDLKDEAQQLYNKYVNEYKTFIDGLEGFTLYDDIPNITMENCGESNRISNDKRYVEFSIEYLEFWETDLKFDLILHDLTLAIKDLSIKIEITEKYNIKKKSVKPPVEIPVDIYKEFLRLFNDTKTGENFIKLLKNSEYISDDEKWNGISGRPGELRDAYYALKELNLLKPVKYSINPLRKFYRRFGLMTHEIGNKGFISDRALRNHDNTKDYEEFLLILRPLVPPQK